MGYNVHDVLKVVVYHTRKYLKFKNIFLDKDLKLLSFLKMKHWIYKEPIHFKFSYLCKRYKQKNVMYLDNYKH
jgi:hypothetical protein